MQRKFGETGRDDDDDNDDDGTHCTEIVETTTVNEDLKWGNNSEF